MTRLIRKPSQQSSDLEGGGEAAKAKAVLGQKITVAPDEFMRIVSRMDRPVVVVNNPGSLGFTKSWQYLTSYKGFVFHTVSKNALSFPGCEMYEAKKIT
jgi:hypothetical protein